MISPLRPHQSSALNAVIQAINQGSKRVLFSLPQGTGKLVTLASILSQYYLSNRSERKRMLFLCDSILIQQQAIRTLNEVFGSELSGNRPSFVIQVKTLQAQAKDFLAKREFLQNFIVALYGCESMLTGNRIETVLEVSQRNPTAVFIGVDSVCNRSLRFFGSLVFNYTLENAISDKVLVPFEYVNKQIETHDASIDMYKRSQSIAASIFESIGNDKTVVFCASQKEAEVLSDQLNVLSGKIGFSLSIHSNKSADNNAFAINRFRDNNDLRVLTNVDILASIVLPNVRNLVVNRQISSAKYLLQIISNYLSPSEGKDKLKIIDYYGLQRLFEKALLSQEAEHFKEIDDEPSEQQLRDMEEQYAFGKANINVRDKKDVEGVLGVKDLAQEIAQIISAIPYEQGRMIGIFGKWGRGKTFLVDQTWKILEKEKDIERVNFHAWKYQDTPAIWAYLFEQLATAYYASSRTWFHKFRRRIVLNIKRLGSEHLLWLFLSIALTTISFFGIPFPEKWDFIKRIVSVIGLNGLLYLLIVYFRYGKTAKDLFQKYYSKVSFVSLLGVQAEVQKELRHLFEAWRSGSKDKKILLFVDDIDRCDEKKIIEIIDSLRVMLEDEEIAKHLIVLTAVDENILKRSIKSKYRKLIQVYSVDDINSNLESITTQYIDKLFILSIKLGELSAPERKEYFLELVKNDLEKSLNEERHEDDESNSDPIQSDESDVIGNKNDINLAPNFEANKLPHNSASLRADAPKEDAAKKLTKKEIELLLGAISNLKGVSPRQIRIFYYRYLIAKNLLVRRYAGLRRSNPWIQPRQARIVIELIIEFGKHDHFNSLKAKREYVMELNDEGCAVDFLEDVEVRTVDYRELLSVLDIVVAY